MNRKIKLLDGEIESFFIRGKRNACGCGSNCFHKENDKINTYGVCNACKRDIYLYDKKEEFEEAEEFEVGEEYYIDISKAKKV